MLRAFSQLREVEVVLRSDPYPLQLASLLQQEDDLAVQLRVGVPVAHGLISIGHREGLTLGRGAQHLVQGLLELVGEVQREVGDCLPQCRQRFARGSLESPVCYPLLLLQSLPHALEVLRD